MQQANSVEFQAGNSPSLRLREAAANIAGCLLPVPPSLPPALSHTQSFLLASPCGAVRVRLLSRAQLPVVQSPLQLLLPPWPGCVCPAACAPPPLSGLEGTLLPLAPTSAATLPLPQGVSREAAERGAGACKGRACRRTAFRDEGEEEAPPRSSAFLPRGAPACLPAGPSRNGQPRLLRLPKTRRTAKQTRHNSLSRLPPPSIRFCNLRLFAARSSGEAEGSTLEQMPAPPQIGWQIPGGGGAAVIGPPMATRNLAGLGCPDSAHLTQASQAGTVLLSTWHIVRSVLVPVAPEGCQGQKGKKMTPFLWNAKALFSFHCTNKMFFSVWVETPVGSQSFVFWGCSNLSMLMQEDPSINSTALSKSNSWYNPVQHMLALQLLRLALLRQLPLRVAVKIQEVENAERQRWAYWIIGSCMISSGSQVPHLMYLLGSWHKEGCLRL